MVHDRLTGQSLTRCTGYLLLLVSSVIILLWMYRGALAPLNYDAAYNLQVVDSLVKGSGYATSGAVRGQGPWLFDPYISTGPTVLLPAALMWWLSGGSLVAVHLLMLVFFGLYIVAIIGLVGWERENPLAAASAVALPLTMTFNPGTVLGAVPGAAPVSLAFWPGMVLGEIPAAALMMVAAWALVRDRPWVAGLALGCAVQAKVSFGLAGLILAGMWLLALFAEKPRGWHRSIGGFILAGVLPTLLFELYRFLSFGTVAGWLGSLTELGQFLDRQNVQNWLKPHHLGIKVGGFVQALESPGWLAVICALGGVCAFTAAARWPGQEPPAHTHPHADGAAIPAGATSSCHLAVHLAVHLGLVIGGTLMLWAWLGESRQESSRQATPALLLTLPSLGCIIGSLCTEARLKLGLTPFGHLIMRSLTALFLMCLLLALLARSAALLRHDTSYARAAEQHHVAAIIRDADASSIVARNWWQNPEFVLLTGLPAIPPGASPRQLLIFQDYESFLSGVSREEHRRRCGGVLYESPTTLVCWLPAPGE